MGPNGKFFDSVNFMAASGSTLNLMNGRINSVTFGTADINNMNLKVDVDLLSKTADTIKSTGAVTNNTITINGINLLREGNGSGGSVNVNPDNDFNVSLASGANTVSGQVFNYNVSNNNGSLSFAKKEINPSVQASASAQQAVHITGDNINNIVFERSEQVLEIMDTIKYVHGIDYKFANKMASADGSAAYISVYDRLKNASVWFRPFNSIETLDISNMEKDVNSISYGAVVGLDTPLYDLRRGFSGLLSFYGGYSGASQGYADTDITQNGGFGGIMGAIYKNNFFSSLNLSAGGYGVQESIYGYGSEDYGIFTTSIASKTGYVFHLPKQIRLQVSGKAAYTLVSSEDYTNAMGTKIETDALHVIQLVPGIKITKNYNGWQPYLAANMIMNAMNVSKVTANDIVLPDSQLGNYVEYGVGIQNYNEKNFLSGFAQVMVRNGARTGVNFKIGLKHPLGENPTNSKNIKKQGKGISFMNFDVF